MAGAGAAGVRPTAARPAAAGVGAGAAAAGGVGVCQHDMGVPAGGEPGSRRDGGAATGHRCAVRGGCGLRLPAPARAGAGAGDRAGVEQRAGGASGGGSGVGGAAGVGRVSAGCGQRWREHRAGGRRAAAAALRPAAPSKHAGRLSDGWPAGGGRVGFLAAAGAVVAGDGGKPVRVVGAGADVFPRGMGWFAGGRAGDAAAAVAGAAA